MNRVIDERKMWVGHQTFSSRPNMMCNLDLYRKGFRRLRFKQRAVPKLFENLAGEGQIERPRMKTVT